MENPPTAYQRLMSALGGTLHAWSQVENGMGILFSAVSGIPNVLKSGAIFDAVVSFDGRLAVLDAAIEHDDTMLAEDKALWPHLSARLRKLYRKRHEVAHFSVIGDIENATHIAPYFTWNKFNHNAVKSLSIQQIFERSLKFNAATSAVAWFTNLVQRAKFPEGHRPLPIEEPALILHIRELASQKKAAP